MASLAPIRGLAGDLPRRLIGWFVRRWGPEQRPVVLAPFRPVRTPRESRRRKRRVLTLVGFVAAIYGFLVSIFPIAWYLYMALPILVLAGLVIWALPESDRFPEDWVERLLFLVFISTFAWPNYLAIQLPGLPWITMVRLFGGPLFLVTMISLSISPVFRAGLARAFAASPWLMRLMIGFVLIQTFTLPLSKHLGDSFNRFLDAQFAWTTIFFVSAYVFQKPGRAKLWAVLLCAMALFLCFLGFAELREQRVLWAGEIPSFLVVQDERVQAILAGGRRAALSLYRIQATFSTSLNFSEFLALATPFFLFFLIDLRSPAVRLAIIAYIPFSFYIIRATDSRLGVVGFFASFLLYLLLWGLRTWAQRRQHLFAPAVVLAYPFIAAGFLALSLVWRRLGNMIWGGGAQQASNEAREAQWEMAIPKIMKWPVGHGVGEGATALGYTNSAGTLTIDSYYLTIGLEYGILGFFVYYGLMLTGVWQASKWAIRSRAPEAGLLVPLAVSLTVFVIIKGVLSQDDSHSVVFMMLGMVAALTAIAARAEARA
jgi:O-antigen ligase